MPMYLVTYHGGGGMPASPEARQQMLAAFGAWVAGVGDAMADPGAPLGASRAVTSAGVGDAGEGPEGYTVLRADSLDAAVRLVQSHPFVARGGTLRVSEAV